MNQTDNRAARARFSDALSTKLSSTGPIPLAMALARAEGNTREYQAYIPCEYCPYASKSHHEASLHARLHP